MLQQQEETTMLAYLSKAEAAPVLAASYSSWSISKI
jgi:hypothetical protein